MVSFKKLKKYALISVYDKKNLKIICKNLTKFNIGIISTGSTYKMIKKLGYDCLEISKLTKSKEVLEGRVKTFHPKIYTSILFDRSKPDHIKTFKSSKFPLIDFIIVNLYPFEKFINKTSSENKIIEMIDIGGSALIRSGSKNFKSVTTVGVTEDYKAFCSNLIKNNGSTDLYFRKKYASKAFKLTNEYDMKIYKWLKKKLN